MSTATTTLNEKVKKKELPKIEFDQKRDNAVREKLITARIALLLKAPFFGNLATRMQLINADDWCPTAATDGRNFYYNTMFIEKLPPKQLEFLLDTKCFTLFTITWVVEVTVIRRSLTLPMTMQSTQT